MFPPVIIRFPESFCPSNQPWLFFLLFFLLFWDVSISPESQWQVKCLPPSLFLSLSLFHPFFPPFISGSKKGKKKERGESSHFISSFLSGQSKPTNRASDDATGRVKKRMPRTRFEQHPQKVLSLSFLWLNHTYIICKSIIIRWQTSLRMCFWETWTI